MFLNCFCREKLPSLLLQCPEMEVSDRAKVPRRTPPSLHCPYHHPVINTPTNTLTNTVVMKVTKSKVLRLKCSLSLTHTHQCPEIFQLNPKAFKHNFTGAAVRTITPTQMFPGGCTSGKRCVCISYSIYCIIDVSDQH